MFTLVAEPVSHGDRIRCIKNGEVCTYMCVHCDAIFVINKSTPHKHKLVQEFINSYCYTAYRWFTGDGQALYVFSFWFPSDKIGSFKSNMKVAHTCISLLHKRGTITDNEAGYAYCLLENINVLRGDSGSY